MKIRTAAFIAPLCFASSLLAVTSFKDNESLMKDYALESNIDDNVAQNELANEDYLYSDILLDETQEDRLKLKEQQRQIAKEKQSKLTNQLNKEAWLALQKQLQQAGEPAKSAEHVVVDVQKAEKLSVDGDSNEIELASLTKSQPISEHQRVLNLEPPIPPGTLGGGNGNGGPGAAQITASAN
ncbi:hypothetical protein RI844_07245 [Thalassotalea fonticola]|uniref:Uncharacterized protein n=1 Tax=Thalassotalea fonticola TaxID=3065649 RepID=A0ABZ0GTL0_9GAMM|nr:hypothetical protein RI844_07245 [Colwelliaceae bacterium S1-1]